MKGVGIQISNDYDLDIQVSKVNGKVVSGLTVGKTLYQNQALILMMQAGEIKTSPAVGVGLRNILLDDDKALWRRRIRMQMELDGQQVQSVQIGTDNKLKIDASYS